MQEIQQQLMPGEQILWEGKPDSGKIFSLFDIFVIPFSIIWCGFAIFWEGSVLGIWFTDTPEFNVFSIIFALFGVPFVLYGLYFVFGRFFYKVWKRKRTTFILTNKRVIVFTKLFREDTTAQFLDQIPAINVRHKNDGSGSVIFGNYSYFFVVGEQAGFSPNKKFPGMTLISFFDIENVDYVYNLATRTRNGIKSGW